MGGTEGVNAINTLFKVGPEALEGSVPKKIAAAGKEAVEKYCQEHGIKLPTQQGNFINSVQEAAGAGTNGAVDPNSLVATIKTQIPELSENAIKEKLSERFGDFNVNKTPPTQLEIDALIISLKNSVNGSNGTP